jgi:DNA polymerase elongation subunit (family B)
LDFYTNVQTYGSKILYRGIENGRRVSKRVDYYPTLFAPSKVPTPYTTIKGEYVGALKPGDIKQTKSFLKQYDGVSGFKLYGNTRFEYCFISDQHRDEVKWDKSHINVCNIDIEVASENGFPEPWEATEPIVSIAFRMRDKFIVLGCQDYQNGRSDITYIKCTDEIHLIKVFLDYWTADYPDIVTGWYTKSFDMPYIINRIMRLLGDKEARRISPWGVVWERTAIVEGGREERTYSVIGLAQLDGLELFKKFVPDGKSRESHKLGDISAEELKNFTKLSYDEVGDLHSLYRTNYQKFIDYNIRDVECVEKIDDKHKLVDLVITLAYDNKCNYEDAFQQVRMWDVLTYNKLRAKKQVVPIVGKGVKTEQYIGAVVKEPIPGKYRCVVSEDLDSLYPHLVMQYNISPDKFIPPEAYTNEMRLFLANNNITVERMLDELIDLSPLKTMGITMTPNGQFFKTDAPGFLTELMMEMYEDRKRYKKLAGIAKKELNEEKDPDKRLEIAARAARYNNLQLAKKVSLNSAYGALGNQFFRFFDVRQAAAITTSGRLAILWIQKRFNAYLNKLLGTDKDYIIAIDTDSVYLCLEDLVYKVLPPDAPMKDVIDFMDKVCIEKIAPFIEKNYQALATYTNAFAQRMSMKRESLADAGIWTGKKRYALSVWDLEGVRYAEPVIKVTGLEVVKSTTPKFCRAKLKDAIEIILHRSEPEIWKYVDSVREDFMKLSFNDVACPRNVNDMITYHTEGKWKSKTPFHVKAAMVYNRQITKHKLEKKYEKIKSGTKVKYLFLKRPNPARAEVIAYPTILPKEFDVEKYIDFDHQFEHTFLNPLRALLDVIGWNEEKVCGLGAFYEDEN